MVGSRTRSPPSLSGKWISRCHLLRCGGRSRKVRAGVCFPPVRAVPSCTATSTGRATFYSHTYADDFHDHSLVVFLLHNLMSRYLSGRVNVAAGGS